MEGGGQDSAQQQQLQINEHLFLGDVRYEDLPNGRVRCVQTGHEMAAAAKATYSLTKKCRAALFEVALAKRTPPLDYFDQSPVSRRLNIGSGYLQSIRCSFKMFSQSFTKIMHRSSEELEARKASPADVDMAMDGEQASINDSNNVDKMMEVIDCQKKDKKVNKKVSDTDNPEKEASLEESDFWVPPRGERWDFDIGNEDRWCVPVEPCNVKDQDGAGTSSDEADVAANLKAELKSDVDFEMMEEGGNGSRKEVYSPNSGRVKIRTKQSEKLAANRKVKIKRKAKRLRTEK